MTNDGIITPQFYDVPMVFDIVPTPRTYSGLGLGRGGMRYAIFDCPFEAMSFAARYVKPFRGMKPVVNRRWWHQSVFDKSYITDNRGVQHQRWAAQMEDHNE